MKIPFICLIFFLTLLVEVPASAQPAFDIRSYTAANGLSQNTGTSILQDRKGLLWLSTWDGLNSFNGYAFSGYKSSNQQRGPLSTSRITDIAEDANGCIWCVSYDGRVARFNPATDMFDSIPLPPKFKAAGINRMPSGDIWLQSKYNNALRLHHVPDSGTYRADILFLGKGKNSLDKLKIYEDRQGNAWIYTSLSGLHAVAAKDDKLHPVDSLGTYCVAETEDEVLFGSDNGTILAYSKKPGFRTRNLRKLPTSSRIVLIHEAEQFHLAATLDDGLFFNKQHYTYPSDAAGTQVLSAYLDSKGTLWIETDSPHLMLFDTTTRTFDILPFRSAANPPGNERLRVLEDSKGNCWFHPYFGGFGFWISTRNLSSTSIRESVPTATTIPPVQLGNGYIYAVDELKKAIPWSKDDSHYISFLDKDDNLWISMQRWFGRISLRKGFLSHTSERSPAPGRSNDFRAILQDHQGRIWAGDRLGEIQIYTSDYQPLGKLTPQGTISRNNNERTFIGNTYFLMEDHRQRIWIGTKGNGLWIATPQGDGFRMQHYTHQPSDPFSLSHDNIYWMLEDDHNRVWIGSYSGGICYAEEDANGTLRFIHAHNRLKQYPMDKFSQIRCLELDHQGTLWVGTTNGIVTFPTWFDQPEELVFQTYQHRTDNPQSLCNNNVQNIFLSSENRLFVGTFGGGLCEVIHTGQGDVRFRKHVCEKGIPADIIYSIIEDGQHLLWLSTENGLVTFNPANHDFDYYDEQFTGVTSKFNEGTAIQTQDGQFIFLTLHGFLHFDPIRVQKSTEVPYLQFTRLQIGGKTIRAQQSELLARTIDHTPELVLPHEQNLFTLHFAAVDLNNTDNIAYKYKLEGFDPTWQDNGKLRTVTYTNLPSGTYRLKVRSTNSDGVWVDNERSLTVIVEPSFWETPVAWCLYTLLAMALLYLAHTFYKLRNRVYIEQQTTRYKLQFFTDVSHELRTPLTLITAPVENLLHHHELPTFVREQLGLIQRNANHMLKLVNQIMEFRKLQSKEVALHPERIELNAFLQRMVSDFRTLAEERHITLSFHSETPHCLLYLDVDKTERILANLLSNAFKYTPNGKQIRLTLSCDPKQVHIAIADEGIGIPANRQEAIFKRFVSLHEQGVSGTASTGIGLALVKELVERQHGTISLQSEEGKGSCFTLHFPYPTHLPVTSSPDLPPPTVAAPVDKLPAQTGRTEQLPQAIPTILLVEDNDDMRRFLHSIFAEEYRVLEATQGQEGLELALAQMPDIIITDLMMPVMDGLQLTNALKTNIQTSHIPVILLTAKAAIEAQLDAMKEGADDYITKPFSTLYLKARAENLLATRRKLQSMYRERLLAHPAPTPDTPADEEADQQLTEADRRFLENLTQTMEQEIGNGELTVDMLADAACMGRSTFFNKVKALLGISPSEFIQQARVKRAAELISTHRYTMAEVSTLVGINDPHYFSRYFKKIYDMTPSEYKKKAPLN